MVTVASAHDDRPAYRWPVVAAAVVALAAIEPTMRPAIAASLQAAPILLEFSPQDQAQALWLSNSGDASLQAQVRVQRWTQEGGEDRLSPTRDLIASPALVEVAPGGQQLVRIVRLQTEDVGQEQAYRLIVDELPGESRPEGSGLTFLLRYSIPVFIGTPETAAARPAGRRTAAADAPPMTDVSVLSARWQDGELQVANDGHRRVRISQLAWIDADGHRVPLAPGLLGYVLAGQRMRWPVPLPDQARPDGRLVAKFDHDSEEQRLPLVAPVQ